MQVQEHICYQPPASSRLCPTFRPLMPQHLPKRASEAMGTLYLAKPGDLLPRSGVQSLRLVFRSICRTGTSPYVRNYHLHTCDNGKVMLDLPGATFIDIRWQAVSECNDSRSCSERLLPRVMLSKRTPPSSGNRALLPMYLATVHACTAMLPCLFSMDLQHRYHLSLSATPQRGPLKASLND